MADQVIGGVNPNRRLEFIDELRGACILLMVFYHACFLLGYQFHVDAARQAYEYFQAWQPVVAGLFVLISGFCVRLSRDALRGGLLLLVCALCFTVVSVGVLPKVLNITNMAVWFGILHCLGFSKVIFYFGRKVLDKIPMLLGAPLSLALYVFTSPLMFWRQGEPHRFGFFDYWTMKLPDALFQFDWLLPLGFHSAGLRMWDYFPLLPFLFLFLCGSFLGKTAERELFPELCYKKHLSPVGFVGRHALFVYLTHLPAFYGLFGLMARVGLL